MASRCPDRHISCRQQTRGARHRTLNLQHLTYDCEPRETETELRFRLPREHPPRYIVYFASIATGELIVSSISWLPVYFSYYFSISFGGKNFWRIPTTYKLWMVIAVELCKKTLVLGFLFENNSYELRTGI